MSSAPASLQQALGQAFASARPATLEATTTRPHLTAEEEVWATALVAVSIAVGAGNVLNTTAFGPRQLVTECLVTEEVSV